MYKTNQLSQYLQKYNTVTSTTNLEVCARSMLSGIEANTKLALDGSIKSLLLIGGKSKSRSPLRDSSVTEVTVPKGFDDEVIYIESVVALINRYLAQLPKIVGNENKIKSILVKLLSNNVVGFYNKLNLPRVYQEKLNLIFTALMQASQECVNRFQNAIEEKEFLLDKLPDRFEYKPLKPGPLYEEYFKGFKDMVVSASSSDIDKFMSEVNIIEVSDDDSDIDCDETQEEAEMDSEDLMNNIVKIIADFGYSKVLAARTDKFMASKFSRIQDDKVKNQLYTIISRFKSVYVRLTSSVWDDTFKKMLEIPHTTYKENRSKVIHEIANQSNSEEFIQFKRLLLE